jgi:hypothetical protein
LPAASVAVIVICAFAFAAALSLRAAGQVVFRRAGERRR